MIAEITLERPPSYPAQYLVPSYPSAWLDNWYQEQIKEFSKSQLHSFNYQSFQERTDRAKAPLVCKEDMLAYNVCYGASHIARLRQLLDFFDFSRDKDIPNLVRIFDYGSGQGLASLTLLEYLQSIPKKIQIDLHLIEPSSLALKHAAYLIQGHPANNQHVIKINSHQTTLNDLPIITQPASLNFHLFSNVLDFAYLNRFDLCYWEERILQQRRSHLCLAVSPAFLSGKVGFDKLKDSCSGANLLVDHYGINVPAHSYSAYEQQIIHRNHPSQLLALYFDLED